METQTLIWLNTLAIFGGLVLIAGMIALTQAQIARSHREVMKSLELLGSLVAVATRAPDRV